MLLIHTDIYIRVAYSRNVCTERVESVDDKVKKEKGKREKRKKINEKEIIESGRDHCV